MADNETSDKAAERKARAAAYSRKWRAENPEKAKALRENEKAAKRQWRIDNPEAARAEWDTPEKRAKAAERWAEWYAKNRERNLAKGKAYREAHPEESKARAAKYYQEHKQQSAEKSKRWRAENIERANEMARISMAKRRVESPEEAKAYADSYRAANQEHLNEIHRAWHAANPEASRAIYARKRAKREGVDGRFTKDDIRRIAKLQRNRCAYCRIKITARTWHIDHIMPLALGGTNWPTNLQLTCAPCNTRKQAQHPIDFARRSGLLL